MARAPAKPATEGTTPRKPARKRVAPKVTPPTVVNEPAPTPRKPVISLPSLESGSTRLRKVILNVAFVLAILIFLPILGSQFLRNPVLIEPIAVPDALIERGMTPEVVASRLWDGLGDATALARTSKSSIDAIPNSQRVQFSVPDVGLSMDSIVRQTRQFFNIYQTRIAGEFVCADADCAPEGMRLRLRVLRGTSQVIDLPPVGRQGLRAYFTDAAVQILTELDPFVALSAISESEPIRAVALARRLIRQDHPDAKWAYNLIGNIRSATGQKQEKDGKHAAASEAFRLALEEYRGAIALDPGFIVARANAAQTLRQLGDPVASRAAYDAVAAIAPDNPAVVAGYAELAVGAGEIDDAIALFKRAAALSPTSPQHFARIGEVELQRGNASEAHAWFAEALAIDPAFPPAIDPLFIALLTRGDAAEAEALMRRAANHQPGGAWIQALHALAFNVLGDPESALAAFDRALAITPDDAELLYHSSSVLETLDRYPEAIERLNRAVAITPYDPTPLYYRASALAVSGNRTQARADFARVLELDISGTSYAEWTSNFLDLLDALDAADQAAPEATP
jgi:tetratricopeptide (TPR) repeat protein